MAICLACREKICSELSADSTQRINAFVEERFDFEMRFHESQEWPENDIDRWLSNCVITKQPKESCTDYQIAGICFGDQLLIDGTPLMISADAIEQMQRLMSKKTRDRLGEMVEDFFGMPSEFVDSPNDCAPVIW